MSLPPVDERLEPGAGEPAAAPVSVPPRRPMTRTNAYSLVVILIRVGALYMVVRALANAAPLLWSSVFYDIVGTVTGVATLLIVAGIVWLLADLIARSALASPAEPVFESEVDTQQWQYILLSVLGAWLAIAAFVSLVWSGVEWWHVSNYSGAGMLGMEFGADRIAYAVSSFVQLVFGMALLLGSRGLVGVLHRLRGG